MNAFPEGPSLLTPAATRNRRFIGRLTQLSPKCHLPFSARPSKLTPYMARVLYSCCGEGQGHSSRVHTVTRALMRLGHEVKVLASNKAFDVLCERLPDVQKIPGFVFVYRNNRVELAASFFENLPLIRQRSKVIRQILGVIESWQPHLAITDFEPFLPRAAKLSGLCCIGLDHQGVIPFARAIPAFESTDTGHGGAHGGAAD